MTGWPTQAEENERLRRARIAEKLEALMREEHVMPRGGDVDGRLLGLLAWLTGSEESCHVCGRAVVREATINGTCDRCRP